MSDYKLIDETQWERSLHCRIFRDCVEPAFCITLELDITSFLKKVKERGFPFTFAMIYAVTKCANEIDEFRQRSVDGKIALY